MTTNNLEFSKHQLIQMKCTTPFVYNAICDAVYLASKHHITIGLTVGNSAMEITENDTAKQLYEQYKVFNKNV